MNREKSLFFDVLKFTLILLLYYNMISWKRCFMVTILVVEDNENARLLTEARLKRYYNVVTAKNGEEALDIFLLKGQ